MVYVFSLRICPSTRPLRGLAQDILLLASPTDVIIGLVLSERRPSTGSGRVLSLPKDEASRNIAGDGIESRRSLTFGRDPD